MTKATQDIAKQCPIGHILDQLNPPEVRFHFSTLYHQLYKETRLIEPGEALQLIHRWIRKYLAKLSNQFRVETCLEMLEQIVIVLERCYHLCMHILTHLNLNSSEFWIPVYSVLIEQILATHKEELQKYLQLQYWKCLEAKVWQETPLSKLINIFVIIHSRSNQQVVSWFVEEPLCVVFYQIAQNDGLVVAGGSSLENWNLHVDLVERNLKYELRPRLRHLLHLGAYPELDRNLVNIDSQWLPTYEEQVTWIVDNLSRTFINRALVKRHEALFRDAALSIARKPLQSNPARTIQEPILTLLQRYFNLLEASQQTQHFTCLLGMICEEFQKYITNAVERRIESASLVSAVSDPKMHMQSQAVTMVQVELLAQLQQNLFLILRAALYSNPNACQITKQVMSRLVNSDAIFSAGSPAFARALAVYIHQELNVSVARVVNVSNLKNCMPLIRYVEARPVFERNIRAYLARRLLGTQLPKFDWERYLVYNLTILYDALFANQLEGMIQDILSHTSIQRQFTQHLASVRPNLEIKVNLLTQHYWSKVVGCTGCINKVKSNLPEVVAQISKQITEFYSKRLSPKKLWICIRLSWAFVLINNISVYLSACQLAILYSVDLYHTVGQIRKSLSTVWTGSEVNYALKLLMHHKVLLEDELAEKSRLQWSEEWLKQSTSSRVGEPNIVDVTTWREATHGTEMTLSHSSSQDSSKVVKSVVKVDHQMAIDAAIVRVIKQKQKSTLRELVVQVIESLVTRHQRRVKNEEVEKRIQHLIKMEYLQCESKAAKGDSNKISPNSTLVYVV